MEKRRIIPLRTELEYAPVHTEDLLRVVGDFACDMASECRYRNRFNDKHHNIFGNERSEGEALLKEDPSFIVRSICRCTHDRIHATWDRNEPLSDDFVLGYLTAKQGEMTRSQKKRFSQFRKNTWDARRSG